MQLNTSVNKKTFFVVLLAAMAVFVAVIFIFLLYSGKKSQVENQLKLVAEPAKLEMATTQPEQIKLYFYSPGNNSKQEVTNKAEWVSNNLGLVTVTNQGKKGYAFSLKEEGMGSITASYQGFKINIPVNVKKIPLEVFCAPFVIRDGKRIEGAKGSTLSVKVGEEVNFLNLYSRDKLGSPDYIYKWTDDEGFKSNEAIPAKKYLTAGTKKIHFFTQDLAGTTAEADCFVNVVD